MHPASAHDAREVAHRFGAPGRAFAGRLWGFTLLFEAFMVIAGVADAIRGQCATGKRVSALRDGGVQALRRHRAPRALFDTAGRNANTIEALAAHLNDYGCPPASISTVSIDMSPAFIKAVSQALPNAHITVDKFHVV